MTEPTPSSDSTNDQTNQTMTEPTPSSDSTNHQTKRNDLETAEPTVKFPPLSTELREMAVTNGLGCFVPFLEDHVPPPERLRVLEYVIGLSADDWEILFKARDIARLLAKAGKKLRADTLPAMLAEYGYSHPNDFRRTLLVAAVVCAFPEFRGKEVHPIARKLIASGWSPPIKKGSHPIAGA